MASYNWHGSEYVQKLENSEMFKNIHRKLEEQKWYTPVLDYTEKSTKVDRVYLVSVSVVAILAVLVLNYGMALIPGAIGFLYPAYKTIAALERKDNHLEKQWLTYWLVICAFNFLEIFLFFLHWLPGYWLVKSLFYFWCYAPFEKNGSLVSYEYLIQPLFYKNRETIENAMIDIVKTAHSVYTHSEGSEQQKTD